MQNRNRFSSFKDSIKKIAVKLEAIANEMARAIKERQRLECLKRRRQTEMEHLRATVFIKVFDELLDGKPAYGCSTEGFLDKLCVTMSKNSLSAGKLHNEIAVFFNAPSIIRQVGVY